MRENYEIKHHRLEKKHCFLLSRRNMIKSIIDAWKNKNINILEVGCSSGVLLSELKEVGYKNLTGLDTSISALDLCKKNGINSVLLTGSSIPLQDNKFDLVISSDVLEHIEDQNTALKEWCRVLVKGGKLVIMVPAFQFLWSDHDVINNHCRRYSVGTLIEVLERNGFKIDRVTYWNFLLFFPVLFTRVPSNLIKKLFSSKKDSASEPKDQLYELPIFIDRIIKVLLHIENYYIKIGGRFPFGVSVLAVATKK